MRKPLILFAPEAITVFLLVIDFGGSARVGGRIIGRREKLQSSDGIITNLRHACRITAAFQSNMGIKLASNVAKRALLVAQLLGTNGQPALESMAKPVYLSAHSAMKRFRSVPFVNDANSTPHKI